MIALFLASMATADTGAPDDVAGAIVEDAYLTSLTPAERMAFEVVDDAVDLAVARLDDEGKLKGQGIPWIGFLRDLSKSAFALLSLAIIVRTRRPSVDSEGISSDLSARLRAIFAEREAAQSVTELRLRGQLDEAKHAAAELREQVAKLQRQLSREEARRKVKQGESERVQQTGRDWITG